MLWAPEQTVAVQPLRRSPGFHGLLAKRIIRWSETRQVGLCRRREDRRQEMSILPVSPIHCGIRSSLRVVSSKTERSLSMFSSVPIAEVSRNAPRAICSAPMGAGQDALRSLSRGLLCIQVHTDNPVVDPDASGVPRGCRPRSWAKTRPERQAA